MSFSYLFICDRCGKNEIEAKELSIFYSDNDFTIFVKDDSWEKYPQGWEYNPIHKNILCGDCLSSVEDRRKINYKIKGDRVG